MDKGQNRLRSSASVLSCKLSSATSPVHGAIFRRFRTYSGRSRQAPETAACSPIYIDVKDARAWEGAKAMSEYEASIRAVREKTARLRALRLAKEASANDAHLTKKIINSK